MDTVPPYSTEAQALQPGIYQHYKGNRYKVIGVARHSETLKEMIVYKALYKSRFPQGSWWVRPQEMFLEKVRVGEVLHSLRPSLFASSPSPA